MAVDAGTQANCQENAVTLFPVDDAPKSFTSPLAEPWFMLPWKPANCPGKVSRERDLAALVLWEHFILMWYEMTDSYFHSSSEVCRGLA